MRPSTIFLGATCALAVVGVVAARRGGPPIFITLGTGAAIVLALGLIYRAFEAFETAAFDPRPETDEFDEENEERFAATELGPEEFDYEEE